MPTRFKYFTDQIKAPNIGRVFNIGLEAWYPDKEGCEPYDLIWIQWCLSQITDVQVVDFLTRMKPALTTPGWIIVKENIGDDTFGGDVYDETDSSVTRTDIKLRELFAFDTINGTL